MLPFVHTHTPPLAPLSERERALSLALRRDVEILALDIGPRGYFAPNRYALAEQFLTRSLEKMGYSVRRCSTSSVNGETHWNLEATLPGGELATEVLVVGAHYDSVEGCPAANDNASGVAGVLACARELAGQKFRRTIRFVLFANEEPPHFNMNAMGSQQYAKDCAAAGDKIVGMVCLETIGCYVSSARSQRWPHDAMGLVLPTVGNFIAFVGTTPSKMLIQSAAKAFETEQAFPLVAAAVPESINDVNLSDHRGFNEAGYRAFMVTDTAPFRYAHYHQATDTPDKLDFESMARVVRGVIGVLVRLAEGDRTS